MSIFSAVAAFLAVVARPANDEVARLKTKINDLERDFCEAVEERQRWQALAASWQRRYEEVLAPHVAREIAAQEVAQRQMNQMMQAQNAQIAQYHQAQMMGMQNQVGLLGAFEGFCNCVPARHDLLR